MRSDHSSAIVENKNPNDKRGLSRLFNETEKRLKAAQKALSEIDQSFLVQVLRTNEKALTREDYIDHIDAATDHIVALYGELLKFKSISRALPSEAESRAQLARDVFAALENNGATLSSGWKIRHDNDPSEADLTGFERLVGLLEIHTGATPAATSKWLREAMARKE